MKIIRNLLYALILLLIVTACGITENEEVIQPGFLKVYITYDSPQTSKDNVLLATGRDFILYNGEFYTDVFQDPEQFLLEERKFVDFNLFGDFFAFWFDSTGTVIDTIKIPGANKTQVAYGSIPPGNYDRLLFQISPKTELHINGKMLPIVTSNTALNVEIQDTISTVVKIQDNIKIESGKITSVHVKFDVSENVYRVLDQFVFNTKVKSFSIENE